MQRKKVVLAVSIFVIVTFFLYPVVMGNYSQQDEMQNLESHNRSTIINPSINIIETPMPLITMEKICIPEGETNTASLLAKQVEDIVGLCTFTISWDPAVIDFVNLYDGDFQMPVLFMIDRNEGLLSGLAYNTVGGLNNEFTIAEVDFEAIGSTGDTSELMITTASLYSDAPYTQEIVCCYESGLVWISDAWVLLEHACIPKDTTMPIQLIAYEVPQPICFYSCTVTWDPDLMDIVFVGGSAFENILQKTIDHSKGILHLVVENSNTSLTGEFIIATLEVTSKGHGRCTMKIANSLLKISSDDSFSIWHNIREGVACCCFNCIPGDMNSDGRINAGDVRFLELHLCGNPLYMPLGAYGDVNSDGKTNAGDIRYLSMYLLGHPQYQTLYPY